MQNSYDKLGWKNPKELTETAMVMIKRLDKYIKIVEDKKHTGKTKLWWICLAADGEVVGTVKWYGGWRKYVYHYARQDTGFYDWDFMRTIADFCEEQTLKHYGKI